MHAELIRQRLERSFVQPTALRIATTLTAFLTGASQYIAQSAISGRFSKRQPRRYAASALLPPTCVSAFSQTQRSPSLRTRTEQMWSQRRRAIPRSLFRPAAELSLVFRHRLPSKCGDVACPVTLTCPTVGACDTRQAM